MIKHISFRNFRKHRNVEFNFGLGLTAVRGVNEGGKSTLIEAMLYSLFGVKACRNNDIVTWGESPSSMRVELTLAMDRDYLFSRGNSGAEVRVNGKVIVTGSKECSLYAASLLRVDAQSAVRLMMASQDSLKSSLEAGPKATSEMIEKLADFDLFDRLIERMQEKLLLGNPALHESKINHAQQQLAEFGTPVVPDLKVLESEIACREVASAAALKEVAALAPSARAADSAIETNRNMRRMHDIAQTKLRKSREQQALHFELKKASEVKARVVIEDNIDDLKLQLSACNQHAIALHAYRSFTELGYPEVGWDGNKESYEAEIERTEIALKVAEDSSRTLADRVSNLNQQAKYTDSQINDSLVCKACGQDLKDKDALVARNTELMNQAQSLRDQISGFLIESQTAATHLRSLSEKLDALKAIRKSAAPFEQFATSNGHWVNVDFNFYPPKLSWKSEPPTDDVPDLVMIKQKIIGIENAVAERDKSAGRVEVLIQTLQEDAEHIERCIAQLEATPAPGDIEVLKLEASRIHMKMYSPKDDAAKFMRECEELKQEYQITLSEYNNKYQRYAELKSALQQAEEEMTSLVFNNNLLKKVRTARPIIADKLWNSVLAAVSTMFSTMRGEKSLVVKGKDGFTVNGQPVESLSGSTLDLLGLAIRVALLKTFLPFCPFLILDEPNAAMDDYRTTQMLGFIAGSGFKQVLLISHESATESVADALIQL